MQDNDILPARGSPKLAQPDEHALASSEASSAHVAALARALGQLFDPAPALVVLLSGPDHRIAYANTALTSLAARGDLMGRIAKEAFPDLVEQGFVSLLDHVSQTREPYTAEAVRITLQGRPGEPPQELYLDFLYQPVLAPDGEVAGVFGQGTDVTGRVLAQRALRESEARLELATRAADLGIWDWNLETGEVLFGPRARTIWGFAADQPVTEPDMAAVIHPDDAAETNARFTRATDPAIRDQSPYEYRVVRASGETRWVRANASALFAERDGQTVAVRYVGTMEDITDAKQRAKALEASEARLRLALDAGRMAVWAVDAAGRVEVTPEFNRLLGLPEDARPSLEELQARYYPGELARLQALGEQALARGDRYMEFEYRHLWPNDEVRWLLVRAELLLDGEGEPLGAIGVVMDITERRESEERLKLLAREVDHRANNLLAVVQGALTLSDAPTASQLKEVMLGRVAALAKAHRLLASSRWTGADLKRLVEDELAPFCGERPDCAQIDGAAVGLSPAVAQAMAMTLHELATNAVKYGALSREGGRLRISWEGGERGEPLRLIWEESGGPTVGPPGRAGTGTKVISRALGGPLNGKTELDWRPEGLVCRIEVHPAAEAKPVSVYADGARPGAASNPEVRI